MIIRQPTNTEFVDLLTKANRMKLDVTNCKAMQFHAAFINSELVGFIRGLKRENINELATLGVLRDFRNKGIGAQLIKTLQSKFNSLYLITVKPKYFKKLGFYPLQEIPEELSFKYTNRSLWHGYGKPVIMHWKS